MQTKDNGTLKLHAQKRVSIYSSQGPSACNPGLYYVCSNTDGSVEMIRQSLDSIAHVILKLDLEVVAGDFILVAVKFKKFTIEKYVESRFVYSPKDSVLIDYPELQGLCVGDLEALAPLLQDTALYINTCIVLYGSRFSFRHVKVTKEEKYGSNTVILVESVD